MVDVLGRTVVIGLNAIVIVGNDKLRRLRFRTISVSIIELFFAQNDDDQLRTQFANLRQRLLQLDEVLDADMSVEAG